MGHIHKNSTVSQSKYYLQEKLTKHSADDIKITPHCCTCKIMDEAINIKCVKQNS